METRPRCFTRIGSTWRKGQSGANPFRPGGSDEREIQAKPIQFAGKRHDFLEQIASGRAIRWVSCSLNPTGNCAKRLFRGDYYIVSNLVVEIATAIGHGTEFVCYCVAVQVPKVKR